MKRNRNILVIDIGGSGVKILVTGQTERRRFPSGPTMTPQQMVAGVKDLAADWKHDMISIGYPGLVRHGQIVLEPYNLAPGWIGFDFQAAFGCPVRVLNDAAMQALGSYQGGLMLFLGLGTGLGSALVAAGVVWPMELAHLSYKKATLEDYVGARGLERLGKKKWKKHVGLLVDRLTASMHPDDIVLGGGGVKEFKTLPAGCRPGDNANAFLGGFRMWDRPEITSPLLVNARPENGSKS